MAVRSSIPVAAVNTVSGAAAGIAVQTVRAVSLWRSLGFEILATVPQAFRHPVDGYIGLHVMYRRL